MAFLCSRSFEFYSFLFFLFFTKATKILAPAKIPNKTPPSNGTPTPPPAKGSPGSTGACPNASSILIKKKPIPNTVFFIIFRFFYLIKTFVCAVCVSVIMFNTFIPLFPRINISLFATPLNDCTNCPDKLYTFT